MLNNEKPYKGMLFISKEDDDSYLEYTQSGQFVLVSMDHSSGHYGYQLIFDSKNLASQFMETLSKTPPLGYEKTDLLVC